MVEGAGDLQWRLGRLRIAFSLPLAKRDETAWWRWLRELAPDSSWCYPRQVHGTNIIEAGLRREAPEADGLVCRDGRFGLVVFGADCPGIVLLAGNSFGIAHGGWRGAARGIAAELTRKLEAGALPPRAEWRAFIGPGICGACYQVGEEVLRARSWPEQALAPDAHAPGKARLDLALALEEDLRALGIGNVVRSGICTHCDARLHSFRHQGPEYTQLLAVFLEPVSRARI